MQEGSFGSSHLLEEGTMLKFEYMVLGAYAVCQKYCQQQLR